jgi:nitrite reductase/ring-hydroxylating ferredoxin subunit
MRQINIRFSLIYFITLNLVLVSCKGESHPVPNVPVNIIINLDLPAYQSLNAPGGYAYLNGGSRGIVVYRNFDEFVALDRHSTHNSEDPCGIVEVDSINVFELVDPCSGSRYSIQSGVVIEGPAQWALRRYNANWNGGYQVSVYN